MDFGGLPPEVNSARMYAGPGPASLLAAATAWQATADEVSSAASAYGSVIADLTSGPWAGPSAWSMAAAASPYVTWLSATGAQAQQTAAQLTAAIGAYESAFAATVPPPVIAANRSLLATLVMTNILGQNTAAIAATEAHYLEMWAQDAAAMYGYAGASAAASAVSAFTPAPQTTDSTRSTAPAAAQPPGGIPGVDTETLMSTGPQLISSTPSALQSLAAPAAEVTATGSTGANSGLSTMSSLSMLSMPARMAMMPMSMLMRMLMTGGAGGAAKGATAGLASAGAGVVAAESGVAAAGSAAAPAAASVTLTGFNTAAPAATAGLGRAAAIGALSVPPAWTGMGVATTPAAAALPGSFAAAAPAGGLGHAMMPPMMPVAGMAGRGGFGAPATQYDFRPTVVPRSPAAG